MRANAAYEVKHVRGGVAPAVLADPSRMDVVEVVELASGESIALWDLTPVEARRIVHALREDLLGLDADQFLARCRRLDAEFAGQG
ncbi:MAG: hypothetical protein M3155_02615 [Actinomycetota bacterium]|nr:hypothetical protein [Actinomycetota bacterium]